MKIVLAAACAAACAAASAALAETASAPADAAAAQPSYNIMGPATCAGWPRSGSITSAAKAVPLNWAIGFVSGSATAGNLALLDLVDPEMMDAWLTTYCRAHPSASIPLAVRTLASELEAKLPPPAPPAAPEPPMFVPPTAPPAEPSPKARPPRKASPKKTPAAPAATAPAKTN